ncbi:predicted protein [Thalassiosira pseudonana CCMP1335]|uniref:Uncharacterized protein n=1 Tax=Thalassiosira pseudonana TaxID=35128 RepID=B8C0V4_THAPS|nr:predicted protein [Thalassiosira pseudonana CCMP1335]EED92669.1 predicted protein [Thalassiosira pseudonana CCMP1335]
MKPPQSIVALRTATASPKNTRSRSSKSKSPAFDGAKFNADGYCLNHLEVRLCKPTDRDEYKFGRSSSKGSATTTETEISGGSSSADENHMLRFSVVRKCCPKCKEPGMQNHRMLSKVKWLHGYAKHDDGEFVTSSSSQLPMSKRQTLSETVSKLKIRDYRRPSDKSNNKVGRKFLTPTNGSYNDQVKGEPRTNKIKKNSTSEKKQSNSAHFSSYEMVYNQHFDYVDVEHDAKGTPSKPKSALKPTSRHSKKSTHRTRHESVPPKTSKAKAVVVSSSTERYELPFNSSTGACNIHPSTKLATKNPRGGWTILREYCPHCTV